MLSQKNKYILYLVLLNGLLTTVLLFGEGYIFQDKRSIIGVIAAMVMFLFFGLFFIIYTDKKSKTINSRQSVNLVLGFKVGKIVLSLIFIVIYAIFVKIELKRFLVVFLVLYFIYMFFDTSYLMNREKGIKR
jgi:drug/metabolite transporter (DMT)-like permease